MEIQKTINNLQEWQGKDEKKRAFILIISEQSDEDKLEVNFVVKGNKQITRASLAGAIRDMPDFFEDASRLAFIAPILKAEDGKTDKDTNADIN